MNEERYLKTPLMKLMRPRLAATPYLDGAGLVLAVSGGMDSMVLLDVFRRMAHVHRSPLRVLHVHHGTGAFADASLATVRTYCERWDLAFAVRRFAWDGRGNFEYEAAAFRRAALASLVADGGFAVLAHHRRDQAETLIQALSRGAGAASPLGMDPQRGFVLRPFLDVARALIAGHAAAARVPHRLDASNHEAGQFRATVRQRVLPVLEAFHGRAADNLALWLDEYQTLQRELNAAAATFFQDHARDGALGRDAFRAAPPYLWPFLLKRFWREAGLVNPPRRVHAQLTEWLRGDDVGALDHEGYRVYCDPDALAVFPQPETAVRPCHLDETVAWGPWRFVLHWRARGRGLGDVLRRDGFRLLPAVPAPPRERERWRKLRLPLRLRQHLPRLAAADEIYSCGQLLDLEREGLLDLEQRRGPEWKSFFQASALNGNVRAASRKWHS